MSLDLCVLQAKTVLETSGLLNPQYSSRIPMSEALVLASSLPTESCVTLGKSAPWELFALRSLTQFLKTDFSLFMWILGCVLGMFTFMYCKYCKKCLLLSHCILACFMVSITIFNF